MKNNPQTERPRAETAEGRKSRWVVSVLAAAVAAAAVIGGLFAYNGICLSRYEARSAAVKARLAELIPSVRTAGYVEENGKASMPRLTVGGEDFVGLLQYGKSGQTWPIEAKMGMGLFDHTVGVYSGSVYNGTLRIGGQETDGELGCLTGVDEGDRFTVTDALGREFVFTVSRVRHLSDFDSVLRVDADLVLFARASAADFLSYTVVCCTYGAVD